MPLGPISTACEKAEAGKAKIAAAAIASAHARIEDLLCSLTVKQPRANQMVPAETITSAAPVTPEARAQNFKAAAPTRNETDVRLDVPQHSSGEAT
jgi:hypothetical protein